MRRRGQLIRFITVRGILKCCDSSGVCVQREAVCPVPTLICLAGRHLIQLMIREATPFERLPFDSIVIEKAGLHHAASISILVQLKLRCASKVAQTIFLHRSPIEQGGQGGCHEWE